MAVSQLDLETIVCAVPRHLSSNVAGETVILGMEDGQYYGLNPVGTRIWDLLRDGPHTVGVIIAQLLEAYEVDEPRVREDDRAVLVEPQRGSAIQQLSQPRLADRFALAAVELLPVSRCHRPHGSSDITRAGLGCGAGAGGS